MSIETISNGDLKKKINILIKEIHAKHILIQRELVVSLEGF